MIPMIDEVADQDDWYNVKREESQIGYTLIRKPMNWKPKEAKKEAGPISVSNLSSFLINFEEGRLNLEQLNAILDMLPFALTFIDEHDKVAYFGGGAEIYPHSRNAIGNDVFSCHTAKSRPLIKKIFAQFHSGEVDKYLMCAVAVRTGERYHLVCGCDTQRAERGRRMDSDLSKTK